VSYLKGVNCASLVLLESGRHVINTDGIKRRTGEIKHIEFVVAIYLVLSVFIPRHQQNVIQLIRFVAPPCKHDSSKLHPAISVNREASSCNKWRLSWNLTSNGNVLDLKIRSVAFCLFVLGATAPPPQWVRASSFTRFLNHTQRRTTVGRTPLDEWSARCRDLYLTTHNTRDRQISMPSVGFETTISVGERPQRARGHWDRQIATLHVINFRVTVNKIVTIVISIPTAVLTCQLPRGNHVFTQSFV